MATLVSPGVSVTVTNESQYATNDGRATVPLIVIATQQDKVKPDGSGIAPYTTKAEAGKLKLQTSVNELVNNYGNPVFYDVNGTIQQGYELNEYGLHAAYKALSLANRAYVLRADVDLAELLPQVNEPTTEPLDDTFWLDISTTKFGIFKYDNGSWVSVVPRVINDTVNLDSDVTYGYKPKSAFGLNGDIAVITVNDSVTKGFIRIFEKISGDWYFVGSTSWDSVTPTVASGTINFSSSSSNVLTNLPTGGDTFNITINGVAQAPFNTSVEYVGSNALTVSNQLAFKTFVANSQTVTFGTTSAGNIDGTVAFTSNTVATGVKAGDVLSVTDTTGTDNVIMRIKLVGSGFTGPLGGTLVLNGVNIDLSSAPATANDVVVLINGAVGSGGTSPQGITASVSGTDVQLIKDTSVVGENTPDKIVVDVSGVTGVFGISSGTYELNINEVVESINDQVNINTANVSASVLGTGPYNIRVSDSATGISLSDVSGTPSAALGLASASDVSMADIKTEIEAVVSNLTVTDNLDNAVPSVGNNLKLVFSGTGDLVIGSGTANSYFGFASDTYKVSLDSFVSQFNAQSYTNTTASVVTSGTNNYVKIVNTDSYEMVISGSAATKLGLNGTFTVSRLYFSDHTSIPASPQAGDVWVKTSTPDNGAYFVLKYYDSINNKWVDTTVPLYVDNNAAFDAFNSGLTLGSLYAMYDADGQFATNGRFGGSFIIKRYNGQKILELKIKDSDFNASPGQTIKISNGRDNVAAVSVSDLTSFAGAINALGQNNLEAELTVDGVIVRNTIGEDIVLEDGSASVSVIINGYTAARYSNWQHLKNVVFTSGAIGYVASTTAPTGKPVEGNLWYDSDISLNKVDILVNDDATNQWKSFTGDIQIQASKPVTRNDGVSPLVDGDLWIDTSDLDKYPYIKRYDASNSKWVVIDPTDQTSPNGILFADARVDANSVLDPDAPNPLLYPAGMLLFNTRASSFVVKEFRPNWFKGDGTKTFDSTDYSKNAYQIGNDTFSALSDTSRWVTISGNRSDGRPYMGRYAQRKVIIDAMASALNNNEDVKDVDNTFFNILLAPGYTELFDELVTLNISRAETGFILTDTPARLPNDATTISDWINNNNNATENGEDGLISRYEFSAIAYPPMGMASNIDGKSVAVPSSAGLLSAIIYNDFVSYPWISPAGINRGKLGNIFGSVGYITAENEYIPVTFSRGLKDVLYTHNINPISFNPRSGLILDGDKTLSPGDNALDRINAARLIVYLRYQLDVLARNFLFEPNTEQTRDQVRDSFDRFFSNLFSLSAIDDWIVICDRTNNTNDRIDRNELWVDVAVVPIKSINFVYIPIRVKNTGSI